MTYLIIAVVAWWLSEGSYLIPLLKFNLKWDRIYVLDCPKCLAFWIGLTYNIKWYAPEENIIQAILCSAIAIFISKVYNK
jgi:hypothetical protein